MNTKFFHLSALKHRATNRISYIDVNGVRFEEEDDIRE